MAVGHGVAVRQEVAKGHGAAEHGTAVGQGWQWDKDDSATRGGNGTRDGNGTRMALTEHEHNSPV